MPKKVCLVLWPEDKVTWLVVKWSLSAPSVPSDIRPTKSHASLITEALATRCGLVFCRLGVKVVGPFERAEQELSTKTPDSELLHKINEARESQSDIANTCRIDESTALSMIVEAKRISMLNDVPASGSTVQSANSSQARTDRDNSRRTRVYYDGKKMPLMTAYEAFVGSFIEAVKAEDAEQFMPLTCAMAEEYDWIGELTRD